MVYVLFQLFQNTKVNCALRGRHVNVICDTTDPAVSKGGYLPVSSGHSELHSLAVVFGRSLEGNAC